MSRATRALGSFLLGFSSVATAVVLVGRGVFAMAGAAVVPGEGIAIAGFVIGLSAGALAAFAVALEGA